MSIINSQNGKAKQRIIFIILCFVFFSVSLVYGQRDCPVCDPVPTYGCGGCVYWSTDLVNFRHVKIGNSKTITVYMNTHPGIVDHFLEFVCKDVEYPEEWHVHGYPTGHLTGGQSYPVYITFTPNEQNGTGFRYGSIYLQYYQWVYGVDPEDYPRWACELEVEGTAIYQMPLLHQLQ